MANPNPTTSERPPAASPESRTVGDAADSVKQRLAELPGYASIILSLRLEAIKASIRKMAILAVAGILGLFVLISIVVMAAVLLCQGIAHGLTALFGGHLWLGELLTGVLILGGGAAAILIGTKYMFRAWQRDSVKKFEKQKAEFKSRFGHDPENV